MDIRYAGLRFVAGAFGALGVFFLVGLAASLAMAQGGQGGPLERGSAAAPQEGQGATGVSDLAAAQGGLGAGFRTAPAAKREERSAGVQNARAVTIDGSRLGTLALMPSCSEAANAEVVRGVALLHHMTFSAAEGFFRSALAADPDCVSGYWGMAMSYVHPVWPDVVAPPQLEEGRALLARAGELASPGSIEAAYVAAVSAYYEGGDSRPESERLARLAEGWAAVHDAYPDDVEATAFYGLAQLATVPDSDKTYATQQRVGAMLADLLAAIPDHPGGLHYTIHAYDVPPLAARALEAAHAYGDVAPENAHALHMTSHIFTRLGMWPESIVYNLRAAAAAWAQPIGGKISHHYLHAVDYLVYAYLQRGEDAAAWELVDRLAGMGGVHEHSVTAYPLAAVPARWALERRAWGEAAALPARPTDAVDWDRYPHIEAISVFAAAIGAARDGRPEAADAAIVRLAALRDAAAALPGAYDWATQVEIQRLAADAWRRFAGGDTHAALQLARRAADLESSTEKNPVTPGAVLPARELYADMLLELGRFERARKHYERTLESAPNRFRSLWGAGRAAQLAGNDTDARRHFGSLLELAGEAGRADLRTARAFLGGQ